MKNKDSNKKATSALTMGLKDKICPRPKRSTHALTSGINSKVCPRSKRSQVTMFIIIGVVIVAIVLLYFIIRGFSDSDTGGGEEVSPIPFLETCLKDDISSAIWILGEKGGDDTPGKTTSFDFLDGKGPVEITYLCYTSANEKIPCMNQEPFLYDKVENEIKKLVAPWVDNCIGALGTSLSKEGYVVDINYTAKDFEVALNDVGVDLDINVKIILTKAEQSLTVENLSVGVRTRLYDLISSVRMIIRDEITRCYFDAADYIRIHPEYQIGKETKISPDFSNLYTVKLLNSPERFRFATRGCVDLPAP
ncbi:MAG: hypothetical protein KKB31_00825 [Nanoarchaeota archaeon]|nr:hypothetical protein [Nanoarchaeota archaeon]